MLMRNFLKTNRMLLFIIAFFTFLCIGYELNHQPAKAQTNQLPSAYLSSIYDASIDEQTEIINDLTAINSNNNNLVWENPQDRENSRILVATWKGEGRFKQGDILKRDNESVIAWVTVVPELKDFCTKYQQTGGDLKLRLEQLLGLTPNTNYQEIVEIWVSPKYLLRPSADPEITDSIAELRNSEKLKQTSQAYQNWFQQQRDQFINLQAPIDPQNGYTRVYPWTGLGYTYDWGDPKTEVGLSEFIIWYNPSLENLPPIEVAKVTKTANYCGM